MSESTSNGNDNGSELTPPAPRGLTPKKSGNAAAGGSEETHVLAEELAVVAHIPFAPGKIDLPLHRRVEGDQVLGRAQLTDHVHVRIAQLGPFVRMRPVRHRQHAEWMAVALRVRRAELVGAAARHRVVAAEGLLQVDDLHRVVAAGRADIAAAFEAQARGAGADERLQTSGERGPVELPLRLAVVDADAATDPDLP